MKSQLHISWFTQYFFFFCNVYSWSVFRFHLKCRISGSLDTSVEMATYIKEPHGPICWRWLGITPIIPPLRQTHLCSLLCTWLGGQMPTLFYCYLRLLLLLVEQQFTSPSMKMKSSTKRMFFSDPLCLLIQFTFYLCWHLHVWSLNQYICQEIQLTIYNKKEQDGYLLLRWLCKNQVFRAGYIPGTVLSTLRPMVVTDAPWSRSHYIYHAHLRKPVCREFEQLTCGSVASERQSWIKAYLFR